jgi:glycosyltransferase involved in cell wall biosynthesis
MVKSVKAIKIPRTVPPQQHDLSLCVIYRDNVDTFGPLLESVAGQFDEYVFVDTGSEDGTNALIDAFAKKNNVVRSTFEWCDDFSKARNHSFAAASGKWRMFLDSDDVLLNGEKLRVVCNKIDAQHPDVKGVFIPYWYDKDENLDTLRLVRWDDHWRWNDAIHERLVWESEKVNSGLTDANFARLADIQVKHKRKSKEEKEFALRRNAKIAYREFEKTQDKEYRARLARTIAMELKLDQKLEDALPWLKMVADGYPHLAEGRQASSDISRILAAQGAIAEAMTYAKHAGPSYEAILASTQGDYEKVVERQTKASVIPQQTTHEGFLFEKVVAPIALADAAMHLQKPVESVERVLNSVRGDLRSHPSIVQIVQALRGSVNRITIVVPGTPQPFDGSSTNAMLGGSEEAVVYLSRALAAQGRNVRVYGILPPLTVPGLDENGIDWQPVSEFNPQDEHGCLVVWRAIGFLMNLMQLKADLAATRDAGDERAVPFAGIGRSSLWLHDKSLGISDKALALTVCRAVDSVIVLSEHHKKCIIRECGGVDPGNFVVLSNGVVREDFEALLPMWQTRDPNRVVYSSCPSRGLRVLLKEWPKIKAACPKAYLDIYYDWSMLERMQPELHADVVKCLKEVEHLDVKHHGGVGHQDLHTALAGTNVWAYSHYENPEVETFCISAVKATAAGCTVITSRNGAVPEVAPDSTFVEASEYADAVIAAIQNPATDSVRKDLMGRALDRFDWAPVAGKFGSEWTVHKARLRSAP